LSNPHLSEDDPPKILRVSTGDGGSADDWDLVLDEDFVHAGRAEPTAAERAERAARISRDHATAPSWRGSPASATRSTVRRQRRTGLKVTALCLTVVTVAWLARDSLLPHVERPTALAGEASIEATATPSPAVTRDAEPLGTPPPVPAGAGDYRFTSIQDDGSGRPVAFDPCRKLHVAVRPDKAPPRGGQLLSSALRRLSRATGLVIAFDGPTTENPSDERPPRDAARYGDRWSPVLIAWSDEREWPDLAGYITGVGGPASVSSGVPGSRRFVSGQVVLDAEQLRDTLREPNGDAQVRAVIMHELGHLVGLQHVADRDQLMFSESGARTTYGTGDLQGLRALGRGTCFVDPPS